MPPKCRFVQPEEVRLYLVDVYKRALVALDATPLPPADEKHTIEQIVAARQTARNEILADIREGEADGYFITVKKELNTGEYEYVFTHTPENDSRPSLSQVVRNRVVSYITGWNLTNPDGTAVVFSEAALKSLDIATFGEIRESVNDHSEAVEKERNVRKNSQGGENVLSAISSSVSTTAGDMAISMS